MAETDNRYALLDAEKVRIAQDQIQNFQREMFGHELNEARLATLPEGAVLGANPDGTPLTREMAIEQAQDAQATLRTSIDTTLVVVPEALPAE